MSRPEKPLIWLDGELKSPPFTKAARIEAGYLLRLLQSGQLLGLPQSRPMPSIGRHCQELRIVDENKTWRMIYRLDEDAVILVRIFAKKSQVTPRAQLALARKRLAEYDRISRGD
ncbi:MAG: type II toxin-antitoxin system RelE/ParE family toxin [Calditrichaeota bacterium]|nr:type II toxin-antitoxin system RelE/ParE family toxin [Calditrichota bacterium]MCB9474841.1 type II toxin-antitoxin system RelE/ParE family toxin [Candidatus Delongbacteria bacterium]